MTLNGVMAVILRYFTDTPHFLRQKCSPKNLVFSDISLKAIFTEVTENECIIERLLRDIDALSLSL